jgi:hypothetical protein
VDKGAQYVARRSARTHDVSRCGNRRVNLIIDLPPVATRVPAAQGFKAAGMPARGRDSILFKPRLRNETRSS